MRKFGDILQSLKPLITWRRVKPQPRAEQTALLGSLGEALGSGKNSSRLTLPRPKRRQPDDWLPLEDSRLLRQTFSRFRDFMYLRNQKTKRGAGETPRAVWESGKLAGNKLYFYLQAWNDRGYLFEESARGWVVARAEKIAMQDQFMRERSAWDHVILYQAADRPGLLRVMSEQMGEGIVSLALYEDFMSQAFEPDKISVLE